MKAVADVLVALEGADAVTHLHKRAGVLQQAHDLSLWQLSGWLVCKGQKQHIKKGRYSCALPNSIMQHAIFGLLLHRSVLLSVCYM